MGRKASQSTHLNENNVPDIKSLEDGNHRLLDQSSDHVATDIRKASPLSRSVSGCSQHSSGSAIYWANTEDITEIFFPPGRECIACETIPPPYTATKCSPAQPAAHVSILGKRKANGISNETICNAFLGSGQQEPRYVRTRLSEVTNGSFSVSARKTEVTDTPPSEPAEPEVIAHSSGLQGYFNRYNLAIGVQWEIARLVSIGRIIYDDIEVSRLGLLQGSNQDIGPKVAQILLDAEIEEPTQFAAAVKLEMAAKSPWTELDKEATAFQISQTAALGCNERDYWYGGKVHFMGKLKGEVLKGNRRLYIELDRLELDPSTRCTRRWGSASLLRIDVKFKSIVNEVFKGKPKKHVEEALTEFFSRPFVLMGRVYRAYFAKDHTVFLILTNERVRLKGDGLGIYQPLAKDAFPNVAPSLDQFVDWFNPLTLNKEQTMVKWSARFALALSNSVPGVMLRQDQIKIIDDIVSPAWDGKGKVPSEMIMTDGCGFANASLLLKLQERFEWCNFPTAVQVRIAGAKGLLLLDPRGRYNDSDEPPSISIRPSQIKIKYSSTESLDPAMLVIDVLRHTKIMTPGRLSAETIVNLSENGVPKESFIKLMNDGMREVAEGLSTLDGPNAMPTLFHNVMRAGGVLGQRLCREYGGESRARGTIHSGHEQPPDEDEDDDEDELQVDPALHQRSSAWWADQVSGQPSTLEETVISLLASGFHPRSLPVLAEKLKHVLRKALNSYVLHYKITLPMSASAFVVPDPLGVLEEGEIHIRISSPFSLRGQDGYPTDIIFGDVLVTRHPCKVPSDCQKVKAVEHAKLRQYTDVIIFSTKGKRSLASMLGGGDYDGDVVTVIWQPEIVEYFKNADPSFADPPLGIEDSFIKNTETVEEFLNRVPPPDSDSNLRAREMQKFLLGALRDCTAVGKYSKMHDCAVYTLGYAHPEAKRLAYMFCTCLDGSKTGLIVQPKVLEDDTKKYGRRPPAWSETPEDVERVAESASNEINPKRPANLHAFIMDALRRRAECALKHYMTVYDRKINTSSQDNGTGTTLSARAIPRPQTHSYDVDLAVKYERTLKNAESLKAIGQPGKVEELERIKQHVEEVRGFHREQLKTHSRSKKRAGKKDRQKGAGFTDLSIETRQDVLRSISRKFASGPEYLLPLDVPGDVITVDGRLLWISGTGLLYFEEEELKKVRASYAYLYDWQISRSWTRYPWDVAFRELCAMKAEAVGFPKTITSEFYEKMVIAGFARAPR